MLDESRVIGYRLFSDVPSDRELSQIVNKYWKDETRCYFEIPFEDLYFGNPKRLQWHVLQITNIFRYVKFDVAYFLNYNKKKVLFFRSDASMTYKYTVQIPYCTRSKYIDFVEKINMLVDREGLIVLVVSNVPQLGLDSYLLIECNENSKEIMKLITEFDLQLIYNKGLREFLRETCFRRWLLTSITKKTSIKQLFDVCFEFAETEYLESLGYSNEEFFKPKVFISYCHKDKKVVTELTDTMRQNGINIWLDQVELDAGDNILDSVQRGMRDCDLAVIFLSEHTKKANFAKFELSAFWSKIINYKKKWFLVNLDNVNPDEIAFSLGDFLYYDFSENSNMESLIEAINKKLEKIKKSKTKNQF